MKQRKPLKSTYVPSICSFFLTAGLLSIIHIKVKKPVMLLLERFQPGIGWIEILILSLYASWIAKKLIDPQKIPVIRNRIWTLFSIVFFSQLLLGLLGFEKLLMTGKLHLPVPALILAGPLFRGDGFFMLFLLGFTLLLVGPAWCSYLCYIGAWDNLAAKNKKMPGTLPTWKNRIRWGIFLLVVFIALVLRISGVPSIVAIILGALFGLLGVGILIFISRRIGLMVHCITYCPIGLLVNWLGRISPFRLSITDNCTDCGACRLACRYEALDRIHIQERKPGITCTLCGDCINKCKDNALEYQFFGIRSPRVFHFFIILVASFHAVFIGVARI